MKLFKLETTEKPVWYFTSVYKLARYIGVHEPAVWYAIKHDTKTKGYKVTEIEDDNILCKYINPEINQ